LEKEKEDAETYLKLTDTIKRITYTTLKNSEKQTETDFNSTIQRITVADERKKDLTISINETDLILEKLSKDKETLAKTLNERSVELSGTNKILENINKEIAVNETQSRSLKEKVSEAEQQITQSSKEKKKIKDELAEVQKQVESDQKELDEKAKQLSAKEVYEAESKDNSQIGRISTNQKRIDELYSLEENLSKQYLQSKFEIESIEKSIKAANQEIESKNNAHQKLTLEIKEKKSAVSQLEAKAEKDTKSLDTENATIQKKRKELDDIYVESVNLKEQIAMLGGGSDKLNNLIKKNIEKGFYGRAYELCTYEQKYELAINAAALNRLSYFVVESAEVADEAIQLIKSSQLGRASFIPIKDLTTKYKDENDNLDKLMDHVTFEKKFEKAFSYIFANTYVVESIEKAKKIGFGKGRFVTLDGEIIEQSGVITGGSKKHLQSPMMLESRLKLLEKQRSEISEEAQVVNSIIESKKKEIAICQTQILQHNFELNHLDKNLEALNSELESARQKAESFNSKLSAIKNSNSNIEESRNKLIKELTELKSENEKIYASNDSNSSKTKSKVDKSEIEKLKALREEVNQLKVRIATLSKEQEMKSARYAEMENEIKLKSDDNKETMKRLAILDSELMDLNKKKKELQEKVGKSDAHSQELYKKIQQQDAQISKFANDKGRNQSDLEKVNRELIEQETRKVQIQTRVNDIKAELLSYQNVEIIKGQTAEELDAKRTIAKNDLERLGAVNLKAPEVYETKKKDVEEAASKLDLLGNEKDSIIAMINEIESKKLNIFNETLNDVNQNFSKLYNYVFEGSAFLKLENQKDPFNSGLSISISSPKNKNSTVDALSGGEKILVMLMLIFAIQTHDPMSFYIFDEIDISLDKENSKKLSRLMKEISKKSQVIVISHNDSLITAADTAIGVVNRNRESRVVGLQLTPTEIKAN